MTNYELSLLLGSALLLFGLLAFVASLTNRRAAKFAVVFLALGGGLLYYAHISNFDGIDLTISKGIIVSDIPDALYKLVGKILN